MKSQRGVRLPNAPATRKHGITKYDRQTEKAQNWRDYMDNLEFEEKYSLESMLVEDGLLEIIDDDDEEFWSEEEATEEVIQEAV